MAREPAYAYPQECSTERAIAFPFYLSFSLGGAAAPPDAPRLIDLYPVYLYIYIFVQRVQINSAALPVKKQFELLFCCWSSGEMMGDARRLLPSAAIHC